MTAINTKYSVGDVVYVAETTTVRKKHPCPDCLDTKLWKGMSPAGGEYTFPCPRCSERVNHHDIEIEYSEYVPSVKIRTIGSVRFDSNEEDATYMCRETGVGSGQVYKESQLFTTRDAAIAAAQAKAAVDNRSIDWVAKSYDKSLMVKDYQLDNAVLRVAKEEKIRGHRMLSNLTGLFYDIKNAGNYDKVLKLIEDYTDNNWNAAVQQARLDAIDQIKEIK